MKQKLLKLMCLLCVSMMGMSAWAADTWEKASSIKAGDVVLIVVEGAAYKYELNGISTTSKKYGLYESYSTSPAGKYPLTVEAGSSNGTYSFKNGTVYLNWSSDNTLSTADAKSSNTSWSVTFSDGNAVILNAADNTRKLQWNNSGTSKRFACYTSSQVAIQLYKKVESSTPTCEAPTFSVAEGAYTTAQSVTLSTTTEGATIYYTTNGDEPTTSSSVYSSAISVSTTTTIKAIAVKDGMNNSSVASATYTIVTFDHAGTQADPYTVADAHTAIDANISNTGVYATGIVSKIVTAYNSTFDNITFDFVTTSGDTEFLEAYRCGGVDVADVQVGDIVVVSGDLTKHGSIYEFGQGCTLVSLTHPVTPTITIATTEVNVPFAGASDIITVTYNHVDKGVADVYFCASDGTTAATYDWITADLDANGNVDYLVEENTGAARTAYFKVYGLDDETNYVYSELVTITQARYVSAVASLPFAFDGKQADIEETNGLTHAGIDAKDYASSPYLKFNNIGDNLVLRLAERPGTLSFDIKGNPSQTSDNYAEGTFQILTSADGVTYDTYRTFENISKDLQNIEYVGFDANVRYIKWIYSAKTSGNVALGNIKVSATYNRATSAGSYGTLCLPYDATVEGAKLYTIAGKELTAGTVTALVLAEAASVEAGKPYIFKATADDVVATFTGSMYAASGAVNGLKGTYAAITAGEWNTYVSGDLYLMTTSNVQAADKETSTLGANRAYIDMNTVPVYDPSAGVKGIRLGFDGTEEATAITELTEKTEATEGVIYNLQGQRMNSLQRGINIVGGKKVLVK